MTKADKALIADNPDAKPHDLLLKGLSESGFNELDSANQERAKEAQVTQRPKLNPERILQPILSSEIPQVQQNGGNRDVVLIKPVSGIMFSEMNRKDAETMAHKNPNKYIIKEL